MDRPNDAMADRTSDAAAAVRSGSAPRCFLFLQGPISNFFDRLGRALIARGHRVHRVNLHFGDRLFWRLPATDYRGRLEDWRPFVAALLDRHRITDLVLHGDRRPYHIIAAEEARARGIAVIATDLGYARPNWLTLEQDGMTTYSRFPRDPAAIRALAAKFPEPDLSADFRTPFWLIASLDVLYNVGLVFGRPLYPHYRYHSICHPFAEYAGWLWSRARGRFTAAADATEKRRLLAARGSYFLVPLQVSTDFQIRAHSPFADVRAAARAIVISFAASGCGRTLVFVVHPLDNGLIGWRRFVGRLARGHGVAGRVKVIEGGTPLELLRGAAGLVTVNSTLGVAALHHGIPVKALGNAVFDVAGLTSPLPLDAFWHDPRPPDPALMADFLRALIGATQVSGGYYARASQDCAIAGFVERLERGIHPLPPLNAARLALAPRPVAHRVVVTGVTGAVGAALARACAEPGVGLRLIGPAPAELDRIADDCRRRGAVVETVPASGAAVNLTGAADLLIVHAGAAEQRDIAAVLAAVRAEAAAMRWRGSGAIALVGGGAGSATAALREGCVALRRDLRRHGVALTVVAPGAAAHRIAMRWRARRFAAIDPDRLAAAALRAVRRRRAAIALPRAATLVGRAARLMLRALWEAGRGMLASGAAERTPVPGGSGPGD